MTRANKKRLGGVVAIGTTVCLSLALVSIPTDTLLSYIGTSNAYLFMYLIAFIGSITTFASIPYPLILLGLVAGGLDPLPVGVASALGVITADTCTFFAAKHGRALLSDKLQSAMAAITDRIKRHPKLLAPGLLLYGTCSPLSNDFAVISLSLMRYNYRQVVLPLAVGNVIYSLGIAYLGIYTYDWISGLL